MRSKLLESFLGTNTTPIYLPLHYLPLKYMTTFCIHFLETRAGYISIEAENEQEAIKSFHKDFTMSEASYNNIDRGVKSVLNIADLPF